MTPRRAGRRAGYLLMVVVTAVVTSVVVSRQDRAPAFDASVGRATVTTTTMAASTTTTTAPATAPAAARCADALQWAAAAGLPLPARVGYHCPSTEYAHHGATCWYATKCRTGRFIAINVELMGPVTPDYFHFVVAHEICHVIQFDATGDSTEAQADACAIAHGAHR